MLLSRPGRPGSGHLLPGWPRSRPVWAAWTPTWTTTTGVNTPSYGNASLGCEYCQTGDLVICRVQIVFGTTTSFGGGTPADNWQFSPPVTAARTSNAAGHFELSIATNDRRYGRASSADHHHLRDGDVHRVGRKTPQRLLPDSSTCGDSSDMAKRQRSLRIPSVQSRVRRSHMPLVVPYMESLQH